MDSLKYINIPVWSLLLCLFLPATIHAQEEERPLDQYLQLAGENNPRLKALFNQYLSALEEVPQQGTLPDPQLTFGVFVQPVETRVGAQRANLSLSQMFPWFGTLGAQQETASLQAKARLQEFESEKSALFRQVKVAYNDLYYIEKAIEATQANMRLLESFKEIARTYFESGRTGFSALLRVEMEEDELRARLLQLQDSRAPLQARFEQLLNSRLEEPILVPDTLWPEEILLEKEELYQHILAENPELRGLEFEVQASESQLTVAKKMGLPSFNLGMSYTNIAPRTDMEIPDNGKDALMFPQLGIRVPVYRKKYKAMEKQAMLEKEAAQYMQESREDQLRTELEELYRDYQDAQRRIMLNENLANLAERSLSLIQSEFTTGETSFEEVIRMERNLLNYRLDLEKARVERNNNVYSIQNLMGR